MSIIDVFVRCGGIVCQYNSDLGEDSDLAEYLGRECPPFRYAFGNSGGAPTPGVADLLYIDRKVIGPGGTQTSDLRGGGLVNKSGEPCSFGFVRGAYFKAATTNASGHPVEIGNGTNPFLGPLMSAAHRLSLHAGDEVVWNCDATPRAISAGVNDDLNFHNPGGVSNSRLIFAIWGESHA